MKVLFAVSNEEISESIVKKYQKEYKQIISYKNVYYFNAILKELQNLWQSRYKWRFRGFYAHTIWPNW